MGLITIEMFATLDLVGQAPGGPDEDPEGFPFGGWQAPLMDDEAGAQIGAAYEGTDALLLGRRTYDIFAGFWPYQEGGEDDEIATLFNRIPKYVASRGRRTSPGPGRRSSARICRAPYARSVTGTRTSRSSAAWIWCRPCCARSSSTVWTSGCTRSCSASARRCSRMGRCPPTSPSSSRRSPVRKAPCTCATGSPTARPRRAT